MHVCLICSQIAAWGKIGGFGTATRALGAGLVRRGCKVSAVAPRRSRHGQGKIEMLDGVEVHGTGLFETLTSGRIFRQIDADVYHSQEPTLPGLLAQRACPGARHVVTCRDPRGPREHLVELKHTYWKRRLLFPITWWYEASPLVRQSVRRADAVFCPAPVIRQRARALYGRDLAVSFVPSPVDLPGRRPVKSREPLALFVGRWDYRKRIERFFELARNRPDIRFIAVGKAHDPVYDRHLRKTYAHLPNVSMPGFVSRFGEGELYGIYEKAWILVNTSAREGFPYTYIEAAAWGCAILSGLNPDNFASRFGRHVRNDAFERGIDWLIENGRWRRKGEKAAHHVAQHWEESVSIREHLRRYRMLLET